VAVLKVPHTAIAGVAFSRHESPTVLSMLQHPQLFSAANSSVEPFSALLILPHWP